MQLDALLRISRATPEFKADVARYVSHQEAPRIALARAAPRIKVLRVLTQLLADQPELPIERVHLDARSGCSDFAGRLVAETASADHVFDFVWCCRWRAEERGWVDAYGFPDQIRAAEEFGWRCFETWHARSTNRRAQLGEMLPK